MSNRLQWRVCLATLTLAAMLAAPALASAGTSTSPLPDGGSLTTQDSVVTDSGAPLSTVAAGCATFSVKVWRDGVSGGRLWTLEQSERDCWGRSGNITSTSGRIEKGSGSLTWDYAGVIDTAHGGGVGQSYIMHYAEAKMVGILHDTDYPWIKITVYGPTWSHSQSCGC